MDLDTTAESGDGASAFGPASFTSGGLLPHGGRTMMKSPDLLVAAFAAEQDGWLSPNNPVLVRGSARILPLAWRGDPKSARGTNVATEEMSEFASAVQSLGVYLGRRLEPLDKLMEHRRDSIGSYASALQEAGITHGNYWAIAGVDGSLMGLTLIWAGDEEEGTLSLACHVVPVSWVAERFVSKAAQGIDLRWSWADVIALSAARNSATN